MVARDEVEDHSDVITALSLGMVSSEACLELGILRVCMTAHVSQVDVNMNSEDITHTLPPTRRQSQTAKM